jgi:dGTPase
VAPSERQVLHSRLTHTLEVAQIARRLAEKLLLTNSTDEGEKRKAKERADELGGIDPDVVEVGALAHDLGHPPFGHVAEKELNRLATKAGVPEGFDGNAQTFRIITRLAVRREHSKGLNLTRATLNAVLKYPCLRASDTDSPCHKKWGAYASERTAFEWARKMFTSEGAPRSAEADLIDWADDVAYAVHDLEDFYRAGLIPLDRLRVTGSRETKACLAAILEHFAGEEDTQFTEGALEQALNNVMSHSISITEPYKGTERQRAALRSMTSLLISRYMDGISLEDSSNPRMRLYRDPTREVEVAVLKRLTWNYVIHNPSLATQQMGHRQIIGDLFELFVNQAANDREQWVLFPWGYRERLEASKSGDVESVRKRIAVDYIASMTEQQAIDMHRRITGANPGSALDPIVV